MSIWDSLLKDIIQVNDVKKMTCPSCQSELEGMWQVHRIGDETKCNNCRDL